MPGQVFGSPFLSRLSAYSLHALARAVGVHQRSTSRHFDRVADELGHQAVDRDGGSSGRYH